MKILMFDIETQGFGVKYDSILEIAAIEYDPDVDTTGEQFHEFIRPKNPTIKNTDVHGITYEKVANCRSEKEVLRDFVEFVHLSNPDFLGGHNIDAFDNRWMREKCAMYGFNWVTIPTKDTLKIARKEKFDTKQSTKTGRMKYTQQAIASALKIEYKAHSAIDDVKALIPIYNHLFRSKKTKRNDAGF